MPIELLDGQSNDLTNIIQQAQYNPEGIMVQFDSFEEFETHLKHLSTTVVELQTGRTNVISFEGLNYIVNHERGHWDTIVSIVKEGLLDTKVEFTQIKVGYHLRIHNDQCALLPFVNYELEETTDTDTLQAVQIAVTGKLFADEEFADNLSSGDVYTLKTLVENMVCSVDKLSVKIIGLIKEKLELYEINSGAPNFNVRFNGVVRNFGDLMAMQQQTPEPEDEEDRELNLQGEQSQTITPEPIDEEMTLEDVLRYLAKEKNSKTILSDTDVENLPVSQPQEGMNPLTGNVMNVTDALEYIFYVNQLWANQEEAKTEAEMREEDLHRKELQAILEQPIDSEADLKNTPHYIEFSNHFSDDNIRHKYKVNRIDKNGIRIIEKLACSMKRNLKIQDEERIQIRDFLSGVIDSYKFKELFGFNMNPEIYPES